MSLTPIQATCHHTTMGHVFYHILCPNRSLIIRVTNVVFSCVLLIGALFAIYSAIKKRPSTPPPQDDFQQKLKTPENQQTNVNNTEKSTARHVVPTFPSLLSSMPILRGEVSISKRSSCYVGTDQTYQFGKTYQLLDGSFLKIEPHDLVCECILKINDQPGIAIELPSSLFSQARTDMQIRFIRDAYVYELILAPNKMNYITGRTYITSFDECLKNNKKEVVPTFPNVQDVPQNYHFWYEFHLNEFVALSPEAQLIDTYGSGKPIPLDRGRLQPISSPYIHPVKTLGKPIKTKSDLIVLFQACGKPSLEIVCDQIYEKKMLYIHLLRSMPLELTGYKAVQDTIPKEEFSTFYLTKNIDLSKITATLDDRGVLKVTLPYLT